MQPIPFCGQAYAERSHDANAQTCVGFYPAPSPTPSDPRRLVLLPTPGYALFQDLTALGVTGAGAVRGLFEVSGALYIVSGNRFIKFDGSAYTAYGTLNTFTTRCSIACNTVELAISDGSYGYVYNLATNAFAVTSGGGFPASGGVTNFTFMDGYTLAAVNGSTRVIQSDLLAAGTFGAQAFAQITSFPDNLRAVYSDQRRLLVMGPKLTEDRFDSGATPFAFEKTQGVLIQAGCVSWATVGRLGDLTVWLMQDADGKAFVGALDGYTPRVLSTPAVNEAIERYAVTADAFAFTYREADHHFYVLTFPTEGVTWGFEVKTGMWHQRRSSTGGRDYPDHCVTFAGKHIVGGADGRLYTMSQDNALDTTGGYLPRERACPHLHADGDTLFVHEIVIDLEHGAGLDSGVEPLATLYISRDGGHTWQSLGTAGLGGRGEYRSRLTWRRVGRVRTRCALKLVITDPVRTCVLGAWTRATRGTK